MKTHKAGKSSNEMSENAELLTPLDNPEVTELLTRLEPPEEAGCGVAAARALTDDSLVSVSDFVCSRHDLGIIADHYLRVVHDIKFFWRAQGCIQDAEVRMRRMAQERLNILEGLIGEPYQAIVERVNNEWDQCFRAVDELEASLGPCSGCGKELSFADFMHDPNGLCVDCFHNRTGSSRDHSHAVSEGHTKNHRDAEKKNAKPMAQQTERGDVDTEVGCGVDAARALTDESSVPVDGFTPNKYEVELLARHYVQVTRDIDFFARSHRGIPDMLKDIHIRMKDFARDRLKAVEGVIGTERFQSIVAAENEAWDNDFHIVDEIESRLTTCPCCDKRLTFADWAHSRPGLCDYCCDVSGYSGNHKHSYLH